MTAVDDALDRLGNGLRATAESLGMAVGTQWFADLTTVREALERLREERDAAWATQGRYFREALAAEAEVRQLREERDEARKQSREASEMYVQANEQITELLQQESFMERKLAAQREDIERLATRVEAAEAENTRLREQRDALRADYGDALKEVDELLDLMDAGREHIEPHDPIAPFLSAGWQCPVCDRRGNLHDERCLVLEIAAVARRRKNGNRRLVVTNGRLRARAEAAEARLGEAHRERARLQQALAGLESAVRILDVMLREPAAEGLMSAEDYRTYLQGAWLGVDEAAEKARALLSANPPQGDAAAGSSPSGGGGA